MPYADPDIRKTYTAANLIKWRLKNPDKVQLQRRRSYLRNREKRIAEQKQYSATHKEQIRDRCRRYRAENPDRYKDVQLRAKYGISIAEYRSMVAARSSRCDICRLEKKLVVDHDHESGRIRGLLCGKCNTALGRLEATILSVGIESFMAYLRPKETM